MKKWTLITEYSDQSVHSKIKVVCKRKRKGVSNITTFLALWQEVIFYMTLKGLRYNQQSQPSKSLWRDLTLPWEHLAAVYIHLILEKFASQAQQYSLAQSFNFSPSISALINNYAYFHIMFLHSKVHILWIISDFLCCWFKIVLWIRNLTLHQYLGGQP